MGIFSSISDRIFKRRLESRQQEAAQEAAATAPAAAPSPQPQAQPAPAPAEPVDVEAVLIEISAEKGNPNLNWRTSIVDLMKLLDLDSSLANRKELATELGYTGQKDGSAEMNLWLHRKVLDQLEANGGHVPASLKD